MFAWNPTRRVWGSGESGFTLVEFLVVAMILILLAAIPLPIIMGATERAREARSSTELRTIEQALDLYYERLGHYPQSLGKLVQDGYLKQTSFQSPWSSEKNRIFYFYAVDSSTKPTAYALGDPGLHGATCGLSWKSSQSVFYPDPEDVDPENPLPCGRDPYGSTSPAYVLGADRKPSDKPLLDSSTNQPLTFTPPSLTGLRLDLRTNR